jgi:hypothetical protein
MAAKKRSASKKTVTIEVDAETLQRLADAAEALTHVAGAFILASDDPTIRAIEPKRSAKKSKKRR